MKLHSSNRRRHHMASSEGARVVREIGPIIRDIEILQVTCWCEEEYVRVPRADVKAGKTLSCGRKDCHG